MRPAAAGEDVQIVGRENREDVCRDDRNWKTFRGEKHVSGTH